MGQVITMTRCPFHGDTDPSLAIYEDGYYCFGCHKSGKLEQWMVDIAHNKPTANNIHKSNRVKDIEQYDYIYGTDALDFFEARDIRLDIAKEFATTYYSGKLLVPTYNINGEETGKQLRFIHRKPKYRLIPKMVNKQKIYPTYTRPLPEEEFKDSGYIVESVYDAMKLYQATSIPSICILGTNMKTELLMSLFLESQQNSTTWYIMFDPDAHVLSSVLKDRMEAYGIKAKSIILDKKPYEISDDNLLDMILDITEEI